MNTAASEDTGHPPAGSGPLVDGITQLLEAAAADKPHAARELLPLVYRSLKELADRQMLGERRSHTLQATALVHEAYLRLVGTAQCRWDSRAHFYAAAAEAMRRILIEHARRIGAKKRGGDRVREIANVADLADEECLSDALEIDAAIEALRREDPRAASVVHLRFYTGLSIDETAAALGIAPTTVDREWRYARSWLLRRLKLDGRGATSP
ncbi:MAG: sigma-70 family RNA polymerase sigma factor [Phycisphaerae bacterium]|nr:sigma-70 family RNA polymerase sigma factor [Planctomycetia bacterium]MCK6466322.1 ECF-type sigma factor [Phycisphaerae bacterium]MCL4720046.1 sigma-70 family RNA polymerase sigma factor [Phycisphaerae bacterium]NUQ10330.1 sigma-70 family RNA polymerase sigma factor [Phycisphaerae bacterium]